jgi:hypothetical protein
MAGFISSEQRGSYTYTFKGRIGIVGIGVTRYTAPGNSMRKGREMG